MKILHVVNISFVIPYFLGNQLKWFEKKGYKESKENLKLFCRKTKICGLILQIVLFNV